MIVQKGNVQYTVSEESKKSYLNQGFDVLDEDGKVIEQATTITLDVAMAKIARLETEKSELTEKNVALEKKIAELETEKKK